MRKPAPRSSSRSVAMRRDANGTVAETPIERAASTYLVDPRPELLGSMKSSELARLLNVETVYISSGSIELTRGLCALIAYSRGLGRTRPLTVVSTASDPSTLRVLRSCCQVLARDAIFDVTVTSATVEHTQ